MALNYHNGWMEKMRYIVIGNINSGKSTFSKHLKEFFPNHRFIAIDDYRKQFGDGTIAGEEHAKNRFALDVRDNTNAIVECSGGGPVAEALINHLHKNSVVIIHIDTLLEECIKRLKEKDFTKIPYPPVQEKIENTLVRIDGEFKSGRIQLLWRHVAIAWHTITDITELGKIPLNHYQLLGDVISCVKSFDPSASLFSFGSLARGELNPNSDIDLFVITEKLVGQLAEYLEKDLQLPIETMGNQISVFAPDNLLLELVVIKELKDASKFYSTSMIKRVDKTVYLGNDSLVIELQKILDNYTYSVEEDIQFTKARLSYYVKSLPRLINKGDDYKYYFHSNIIIHEVIRLIAFAKHHIAFNYLPKMARKYLSDEEWETLQYHLFEDKEDHYKRVKQLVDKILSQYHY